MPAHGPAQLTTTSTAEERDRTFRRVIVRIVPFATLVYVVAWIDRANVGFAKLTMLDDLRWSETVYGIGAGIFFLGYFLFEVPSNLLMQRIGAPRTIMRIGVGWGVATALMAFATAPWHFYALRFLQGGFEAGLHPGLILYATYWLPAHRRAKAVAIFMSASPLALLVGSPLAGYVMTYSGGLLGTAAWQWLFLVEGLPAIILGVLAVFLMPDRPANARWLSADERDHVECELAADAAASTGREHRLRAALTTRATWVLTLVLFCILAGNATLSFYGPSLVEAAVHPDFTTLGWIMSGIFAFGWLGMVGNGWLSDRRGESRRFAAGAVTLGVLGLLLAALAQETGHGLSVIIALGLSAAGTMGSIPVFWGLPPRFLSGTGLAAGVALINSVANLAGFLSPQVLGVVKTTTGSYSEALCIVAGMELVAVIAILVLIPRDAATVPSEKETS